MEVLIKNTQTPLLIKNTLKWELLKWDLSKWKEILGNEKLAFRSGKNHFTQEPQFENYTAFTEMTFEEFLNVKTDKEWFYFDYKYLRDWLVLCEELHQHISWKEFGFPEVDVKDSTIWIGSKGAHTPCHIDSYGCNIIAQVYGRKKWLLFPPEEDLQSTRIPYEESSTFSKINFFTPTSRLEGINNCYSIVLNPGDVLVVPHKWWHYVENLDLAISINTWIKLPIDHMERVKEAIVRMTFSQYLKELHPDIQAQLITRNVEMDMFDETSIESTSLISECLKQLKQSKNILQKEPTLIDFTEMLNNFPNIHKIQPLTVEEFQKFIDNQCHRFITDTKDREECSDTSMNYMKDLKKVLDAIVHSDVVELIYKKLSDS